MGMLDDMTKGITDRKAAAAGPKLTPVGVEANSTKPSIGVPDVPEVFLTNEAIRDIAKDLRAQAALLIQVADGLDLRTTMSTTGEDAKVVAAETKKAVEQEGDRKAAARKQPKSSEEFAEHLAAITAEARAAAFTSADAPAEEPAAPATPASGWTCTDHPTAATISLTSRKGREYRTCAVESCDEFQK